jgi:hypothetical protein
MSRDITDDRDWLSDEMRKAWKEIPRSCLTGYDADGGERVLTLAEAIRALVYERDQAHGDKS